jgi:hypothetical protein
LAKSQADPHRGHAAVELALVMPVVVVFMLLINGWTVKVARLKVIK